MSHDNNQVTLLQLAAAQLTLSLQEMERPFDELATVFIEIAEGCNTVTGLIGSNEKNDIAQLRETHKTMQTKVRNAIVNFQFYDRMTQRLQHILSNIQDAIDALDTRASGDEGEWSRIFAKIEKTYTMREEIELFNSIRSGVDFEVAVKSLIVKTFNPDPASSEIEFF